MQSIEVIRAELAFAEQVAVEGITAYESSRSYAKFLEKDNIRLQEELKKTGGVIHRGLDQLEVHVKGLLTQLQDNVAGEIEALKAQHDYRDEQLEKFAEKFETQPNAYFQLCLGVALSLLWWVSP
ncbi:hypothetical protein B0H10DRAFT_1958495 [Mycena sp. CBHHK59/15]|nr:hypothetical protein B0H10DRAFT_1958495 [Mycena sp. CBHHK59/15]